MKLFKVTANGYSLGECKTILVIAEDDREAVRNAKEGKPFDWRAPDIEETNWEFTENQYPLSVEEISLTEPKVVLSEYFGG